DQRGTRSHGRFLSKRRGIFFAGDRRITVLASISLPPFFPCARGVSQAWPRRVVSFPRIPHGTPTLATPAPARPPLGPDAGRRHRRVRRRVRVQGVLRQADQRLLRQHAAAGGGGHLVHGGHRPLGRQRRGGRHFRRGQ